MLRYETRVCAACGGEFTELVTRRYRRRPDCRPKRRRR